MAKLKKLLHDMRTSEDAKKVSPSKRTHRLGRRTTVRLGRKKRYGKL